MAGSARDPELARYSRQALLPQIGSAGQAALRHATVTLVGCGALGCASANLLVRAGLGALRIIDRDFIEPNNLHRQTLFDEQDVAEGIPKAEAAARKLRRANSGVEVEALVADFNPASAEELCGEADLLLDGTDNLETRYLLNDLAVARGLPWVYGACIGTEGRVLPIVPGRTACLRCVWDEPPAPGTLPTCDTAGVLASAAVVVAGLQVAEVLKLLVGRLDELSPLLTLDVWTAVLRKMSLPRAVDCPCCVRREFEFLEGRRAADATVLCGRDAVQILPPPGVEIDLRRLSLRLPGHARAKASEYMLRFQVDAFHVTLFPDGRAIVQGATDPAVARTVLAKYVGT